MKILLKKQSKLKALYSEFLVAMLALSAAASLLLLIRFSVTGSLHFGFLVWNLILAWLPALAALWFIDKKQQATWKTALLFIVWLAFLPNAFYIVSDFIHVRATGEVSILFDVVLLFGFSVTGFLLGLASLGVMHRWLSQRLSKNTATVIIASVIFLCSFAIYLGRYLRWNSWDIIVNPLGLLIDVSDRVINPLDHPRTLSTTFLFFGLIGVSYGVCWWLASVVYKQFVRPPAD